MLSENEVFSIYPGKRQEPGILKRFASILLILCISASSVFLYPNSLKAAVLEGSANEAYTVSMGRNKGFDASANRLAALPDGGFIAAGSFATYSGSAARRIAKISASGIIDSDFIINVGTGAQVGSAILDVAIQPDGKIVAVGTFTAFNGVSTNRVIRLNADGTRDATFSIGTGFNDTTRRVSVRSDGKIVVGGDFTSYNGSSINRIALLNSDGSLDTAFRSALGTGPNALVTSVRAQPDGKILLSGNFTSVASTSINRVARLNSDGTIDSAFVANIGTGLSGSAGTITLLSDDRILLGGSFATFNGTTTSGMVRLNPDGTLNGSVGTGFNAIVYDFQELDGGKVVVTGTFSTYKGVIRRGAVLLNDDLTVDTSFSANLGSGFTSGSAGAVIRLSDGGLVYGGSFTVVSSRQHANVMKTDSSGNIDPVFDPNFGFGFNDSVLATTQRPDGKILYVGNFTRFSSELSRSNLSAGSIMQFDSSNQPDAAFNANVGSGFDSSPNDIALQPDGKLVVVGGFTTYNGISSSRIIRLNPDGTKDTTLSIGTGFNALPTSVAVQPDGKIIVGGYFTSYRGSSTTRVARLNPDGSLDETFRVNIGTGSSGIISDIAIQSDGGIILGGPFTAFNGVTVNKIVRLNQDGVPDSSFTSNAGTAFGGVLTVTGIAIQPDNKIVAVGTFTTFNGAAAGQIARINADGTADTDFNQNVGAGATGGSVTAVLIQRDGKIVASGDFTTYRSVSRNRIVRLESNGTVDSVFSSNNGTGFNLGTYTMTLMNDNNILVGGYFKRSAGTNANMVSVLLGPEMPPPDIPPPTDLDAPSDTGKSATDNITNDASPTFTGTASSSASIYLYAIATTTELVGTTTADGSGNYSVTSAVLADGAYSIAVVQSLYGTMSATSSPISITVDTAPPSLFSLTPSNGATGASVTSSLRLRLNESIATTSGTVQLYASSDGSLAQSASVASSSVSVQSLHSLVYQPAQTLQYNASYYVIIGSGTVTDLAGNAYGGISSSSTWSFTTAATPTPATLGIPDLATASDTGTSSSDNVTSDTTPTFTGSAIANATVFIYRDGSVLLGTTTASGGASYSFTSANLPDGTYSISAVQESLGVRSATSSSLVLTIDTSAPTPVIGSPFDGSTVNSWGPTVSWDSSSGCSYSFNGAPFLSASCLQAGADILSPGVGNHTLVLRGADLAGNLGYATSSFILAGSPPLISQVASSTSFATATVSWTTDIPSTSVVRYGLTTGYGSTTGFGAATSTFHTVMLSGLNPNSLYYFQVLSSDEYGQTSTSSGLAFRTTPIPTPFTPNRPDLASSSDTGVSDADNVTSVSSPTFMGTSSPGALIYLYEAIGGDLLGTTTSNASGEYSVVSAPMSDGVKGIAIVQELLGVRSATSSRLSVTIDSVAPAASVSSPADGSTVSAWNPSIVWGDATACSYSFDGVSFAAADCTQGGTDIPSPGEGTYTVTVRAIDQAGNVIQFPFIITLELPPIAIYSVASSTASTTAAVTWSTNVLATSLVQYGTTTSYGFSVSGGAGTSFSHSISISGLEPSTLYHFRISSTDMHGHSTTSQAFTFNTRSGSGESDPSPGPSPSGESAGMESGVGYNAGYRSYPTLTPDEVRRIFASYLAGQAILSEGSSSSMPSSALAPAAAMVGKFTRDLGVGSVGEDVRLLQVFLNANGHAVTLTGTGSAGKETGYFGQATRNALARLQAAYAIRPAAGYFGPLTRALVNRLVGAIR